GGVIQLFTEMHLWAADQTWRVHIGQMGRSFVRLGPAGSNNVINAGGVSNFGAPTVSPAYLGVGYVIGPELAALQFSGSVLAWGLLVPMFIFFLGPNLQQFLPPGAGDAGWDGIATAVWRYIE